MPKNKKYKKSLLDRLKRPSVVAIIALVLVLGAGFAYAQIYRDDNPTDSANPESAVDEDGEYINMDPATEEDKRDSEEHKNSLAEDKPGASSDAPSGSKQVTPIITYASRTEVNAYVSGVFEEGGTCTATATKGSQTISKSSKGFENVSYTSCAPISWSLSPGTWSVVLTYSSSKAKGQSEPYSVN